MPEGITFLDATHGWAAVSQVSCEASASQPQPCQVVDSAIYATSDGGMTWKLILDPAEGNSNP